MFKKALKMGLQLYKDIKASLLHLIKYNHVKCKHLQKSHNNYDH
jgi:hypothetical protein